MASLFQNIAGRATTCSPCAASPQTTQPDTHSRRAPSSPPRLPCIPRPRRVRCAPYPFFLLPTTDPRRTAHGLCRLSPSTGRDAPERRRDHLLWRTPILPRNTRGRMTPGPKPLPFSNLSLQPSVRANDHYNGIIVGINATLCAELHLGKNDAQAVASLAVTPNINGNATNTKANNKRKFDPCSQTGNPIEPNPLCSRAGRNPVLLNICVRLEFLESR
jgi:hypothetical protein